MKIKTYKKLKNIAIIISIIVLTIFGIVKTITYIIDELGLNHISEYKNYNNMIELKLDTGADFAFILDDNNKVIKSLYFSHSSLPLELENLEQTKIDTTINQVIEKLIRNNNFNKNLYIIEYNDKNLSVLLENIINQELLKNNIKINIIKEKSTLGKKVKSLGVDKSNTQGMLIALSLYSTDIINNKNSNRDDKNYEVELTKDNAIKYSNIIYDKLTKYQESNYIINEDINNNKIKIELIPVTSDNTIYPDSRSWYYIKDSKVYAYIEFSIGNINYSFCYNGDKINIKEGECLK